MIGPNLLVTSKIEKGRGYRIYVPRFVSEDGIKWLEEGIIPSDYYECGLPLSLRNI